MAVFSWLTLWLGQREEPHLRHAILTHGDRAFQYSSDSLVKEGWVGLVLTGDLLEALSVQHGVFMRSHCII